MPLRKALLSTTTQSDNAASFVNVTAERLHIRKLVATAKASAADTLGEMNFASLDEVPVQQQSINDSRSHILNISYAVTGGTGAVIGQGTQQTLSFNRDDLVLDPDEALFWNTAVVVGAAIPRFTCNIWYQT